MIPFSSRLWFLFLTLLFLPVSALAEPTRIYLDFGFGWDLEKAGSGELGSHPCDGLQLHGCGDGSELENAGLPWGTNWANLEGRLPRALMPLAYQLAEGSDSFHFDYDGKSNGVDDDAAALARDIVEAVEEHYAPFDVEVIPVAPADLDGVREILESNSTNDAYIFVAGFNSLNSGVATRDLGNQEDNIGFSFAGNSIGTAFQEDFESVGVASIARTAAHEAAHTFGLRHTNLGWNDPSGGDLMSYMGSIGRRFMRFPMQVTDGTAGLQNSYQVLADVLGLRPGAPAYVTGTGLHDRITVTASSGFSLSSLTKASVTVEAYSDPERTEFVEEFSYDVNIRNGVRIEALGGDDYVSVGNAAFPVEIYGGSGDDELRGGNKNDLLVGGIGDDLILPGWGNDRVAWLAPFYQVIAGGDAHPDYTLGTDTLQDVGGSDTLDFGLYHGPINLDLSSTQVQNLAPATLQGPITICPRTGCPPPPEPTLQLELLPGGYFNGPNFENVIGTDGSDTIAGNASNNRIEGGLGNDQLGGNGGKDALYGQTGNDTCTRYGATVLCADAPMYSPPRFPTLSGKARSRR